MRSGRPAASGLAALLAATVAWSLGGCDGCGAEGAAPVAEPAAEPVAEPPPSPRPAVVAPVRVASPAAFDLVATAEGAVLVWAPPPALGGGVRARPLDPLGGVRGGEVLLDGAAHARDSLGPGALVVEVAAAAGAGRLGVAWSAQTGPGTHVVRATHGDARELSLAPPESVGDAAAVAHAGRARLELAASEDGSLLLTWRTTDGPCQASRGACARYVHRRLGRPEAAPRGIERNEVRAPCEPLLPGSIWTRGTLFQALCSAEDAPTAHVFAIRDETSYAAVHSGPAGCAPVGLAPLSDGAVAVTRCEDGLAATRLSLDGQGAATTRRVHAVATCSGAGPILGLAAATERAAAAPAEPAAALFLDAPQSRVEALLPEEFAPAGARAVWTGDALLVAAPQGSDVFVRRYVCRPGRVDLARDDPA